MHISAKITKFASNSKYYYHMKDLTKQEQNEQACSAERENLRPQGKDLNRLKVVLAEKKRTNKWLADQLGKNYSTVSKWCTNTSQPDLVTLDRIAQLLDCPKSYLLVE